ncbi:hypothetical protein HPG69_002726 [Diceros bicornis minor]|uniref:C-reactive protein n=1 Tax=Diceros bicornis minor TaxID=77932 RepID=A0A7J7FLK4_DICBM|nr:hypothetical protein HPG69_002726 [Diceros bicornis minor]
MEKLLLCFLIIISLSSAFSQTDMSKKTFVFPKESNSSFVTLTAQLRRPFTAFTVCLRVYTDLTRAYSLFSYATRAQYNEILLFRSKNGIYSVTVSGTDIIFKPPERSAPMHFCMTWESSSGIAELWVDGKPMFFSPSICSNIVQNDRKWKRKGRYCDLVHVGPTGSKRGRISVGSWLQSSQFSSWLASKEQRSHREKGSGTLEEEASGQTSEEKKVERKLSASLNSPSHCRPGNLNLRKGGGRGRAGLEDTGVTDEPLRAKALEVLTTRYKSRLHGHFAGRARQEEEGVERNAQTMCTSCCQHFTSVRIILLQKLVI